jgi:hypothetical protein
MAKIVRFKVHRVKRSPVKSNGKTNKGTLGSLCAAQTRSDIPFRINRVFYIFGSYKVWRGGHRHHKAKLALIGIAGKYEIRVDNGKRRHTYLLDSPNKCLLLDPQDWHIMRGTVKGSVLLVLSSMHYNVNDYIDKEYER